MEEITPQLLIPMSVGSFSRLEVRLVETMPAERLTFSDWHELKRQCYEQVVDRGYLEDEEDLRSEEVDATAGG